jgi:hypothetical protein
MKDKKQHNFNQRDIEKIAEKQRQKEEPEEKRVSFADQFRHLYPRGYGSWD